MKRHMWIVVLALVTIAGCSDDGSAVGPSSVVVRGPGRDVAPIRAGAVFIDPSKECQRHSRPIFQYPWYPSVPTCQPSR
jgi:hypothetical protein